MLSFRLTVPLEALDELASDMRGLELEIATDDERIEVRSGGSFLGFRLGDESADLDAIELTGDRGGAFFHRVVADLMSTYQGDLHAKLTWSGPEGLAEVRIEEGKARYPSLGMKNVVNLLQQSAQPLFPEGAGQPAERPADEADEIEQLLEKGRAAFAEYQKLKGQ